MIFGVFERHPRLKLVLTEVPGVFWDEMCLRMDSLHESPIRRREQKTARTPSEYAASNVWMGNSFQSRQEAKAAIAIGREDRFLWGSDYPHPEGTYIYTDDVDAYPRTRLSIAHNYHGLPIDKVRKLLGDNALDAFRASMRRRWARSPPPSASPRPSWRWHPSWPITRTSRGRAPSPFGPTARGVESGVGGLRVRSVQAAVKPTGVSSVTVVSRIASSCPATSSGVSSGTTMPAVSPTTSRRT